MTTLPAAGAADVDVVVVGAGQAGLASGYFLARAGLGFVVLDADAGPGGAWQHRWPSLRLDTTHHLHDLPGMPFRPDAPDLAARVAVPAYFGAYERAFGLDVRRPVRVLSVDEGGDGRLLVRTSAGAWRARALISATGTWSRPFVPAVPGRELFGGREMRTVDYAGAAELAGRHVVVVGAGASAVQLLDEISKVTTTTWVTRRPPVFRDGDFTADDGRAVEAAVAAAVGEGRLPGSVVSFTGLVTTQWVRSAMARGVLVRQPMFAAMTADGIVWPDGRTQHADVVLWATGFRHEVAHLAPLRLREPGGGIRLVGTRAARDPRVHLVGFGPSASTLGAGRAARAAVREVRALLAESSAVDAVAQASA